MVGDGVTLNTSAIQAAIDKLSKKGGGTLTVGPGRYLTGAILMRSGVELHLEKGAVLLGSTDINDYSDLRESVEGAKLPLSVYSLALIQAHKATNIKLSGEGIIDGQGRELALNIDSLHLKGIKTDPNYFTRLHRPRETARPNLFSITNCKDVEISDLHCRNSACWGLVFVKCENLRIEGVDVFDRAYWNNDGFDIVDCHHVVVKDCHVDAADDGICLKSDDPNDTNDDVLITDCRVESSASAIKFGTNSFGGFQNITIRNIQVKNTFRSAIAIEGVDGGIIRNVLVEHITATHTGNPIFIRLGKRHGKRVAVVENITIRNLTCDVPFERPDKGYDMRGPIDDTMRNPMPSSITGIPGAKVNNVVIENVCITYPGRASKGVRYIPLWNIRQIPEQQKAYPEFDMFGELPCYGFYVRHADGVTFRNISLKLDGEDFRPAFVLDDATNVTFDGISYPMGKETNQIYDSSKQ